MNISRMRTTQPSLSFFKIFFFLLVLVFSSYAVHAADLDLEKDLQGKMEQSKRIVETARLKQKSGSATLQEAKRLRALGEDVAASDMLFKERFKNRGRKIKGLNKKAADRHQAATESYATALDEYLDLINTIPANGSIPNRTLKKLETLLNKIVHKKTRPIIGSLPYKHLGYAAKEPSISPIVTPAYRGGTITATYADTQVTVEAPISPEIVALAQSLNWNPVLIYEYVKNNIETEWYFGCMKGAEDTLHQMSGNDCDQATLLVALMRASGYPTRYVRGVVEFFPDIEKAKNLTGVSDPAKLGEFFQKAGIPFHVVMDGTLIKNIQIDHVYVETQVPYSNYRGAIMDAQGPVWIGLDTSIKAKGYTSNNATDLLGEYPLTSTRDQYLGAIQTQTPLAFMQAGINTYLAQNHPGNIYGDYLNTRTLTPEVMQILPSSLQFKEIAITGEYTSIPSELIHTVKFLATDQSNNELFSTTLNVHSVSNKKVIISYEPETVDDHAIIASFGGLDNTPAYLVHLRPVLTVGDEQVLVAGNGTAMGANYNFAVTISSPNSAETFTNSMISGNLTAIGIASQNAVVPAAIDQTKAADLLSREALRYIDNWNKSENELASLVRVSVSRPVPTVVTLANTIDVTYLLDQPQGFEWKGLFLDADLKAIEAVRSQVLGVGSEREKTFMQLSALQGSVLENKLFEDAFGVGSISTAKLFGLANSNQPATPILTIDQANIAAILPTLPFDDNIKQDITEAVANNSAIRIPQAEITYQDWTGIGYIKENTITGEAGYMLSGMVAGGMTAMGVLNWPEPWVSIFPAPGAGSSNPDPAAAFSIAKITGTDYQPGQVVDTFTTLPLTVLVRDNANVPVRSAQVTFTIRAGGGSLLNEQTGTLASIVTVTTDTHGWAQAKLKLGKLTSDNREYIQKSGDTYPTQVGENIVDATLGSGPNTGTSVSQPFTTPAFPDRAVNMTGSGNGSGNILSFYGTVDTYVTDIHGNPVANIAVTYASQQPSLNDPSTLCVVDSNTKGAQLFTDKSCKNNFASWDECTSKVYALTVPTLSDGSLNMGVVLGNLPNATYPIAISATLSGTLTTKTINASTYSFGNCDAANPPQDTLTLQYFYEADALGNNIDARPANVASTIWAKAFVLSQVNGVPAISYPPGMAVTVAARNTNTAVVTTYTATNTGNGKFAAQTNLNTAPYDVTINATYAPAAPRALTTRIYGVEIQTPNYLMMPIEADGYAMLDTALTYTIVPSVYLAASAQIALYKNDTIIAVMQTEKQVAGFGTIAQGFKFDKNSNYYYQVILNYERKSEIWSRNSTLNFMKKVVIMLEDIPIEGGSSTGVDTATVTLDTLSVSIDGGSSGPVNVGGYKIEKVLSADGTSEKTYIWLMADNIPNSQNYVLLKQLPSGEAYTLTIESKGNMIRDMVLNKWDLDNRQPQVLETKGTIVFDFSANETVDQVYSEIPQTVCN